MAIIIEKIIKVVGNRVLIKKVDQTETTESGLIITTAEETKLSVLEGVIKHLGSGKYEIDGFHPMSSYGVEVGNIVKYQNRLKTTVNVNGEVFDSVTLEDIILVTN